MADLNDWGRLGSSVEGKGRGREGEVEGWGEGESKEDGGKELGGGKGRMRA